jgi:peptidyl-prolyl cis-trans isomerase B (cyclophilin B)
VATGGKDRQSREQRERARAYQVRQELHRRQGQRRRRDNLLGIVVGLVVIAGAIGAQTAYFVAGPGAPAPAPTVTDSPSPSTSLDAPLPEPEETTAPTP